MNQVADKQNKTPITKIMLPTRPQADTLVALFLLKEFGEATFPGVASAEVVFNQQDIGDKSWETYQKEGTLLLDTGGGPLDHHNYDEEICLSQIVTKFFGQENNKVIKKLVEFARRDDIDGQGTLSEDPIDKALGLSGLIVSLNRVHTDNPQKVYEIVTPLLDAHYKEQYKRIEELPKLFSKLLQENKAQKDSSVHRGKKRTIVLFESDDPSLASYLRSFNGGNFDVVIQIKSSGHTNILTHTNRRPDLQPTAVILRKSELLLKGSKEVIAAEKLAEPGRLELIPEWYFDLATNSIQNGGVTPGKIPATKIPPAKILELVRIGLEEKLWKPKEASL